MVRTARRLALASLVILGTLPSVLPANAACAANPDALTFHQMIRRGETGNPDFDVMILGKVASTRDLGGGRGGRTNARISVAATPAGSAPHVARVSFYRPPPGVSVEDNFEFHVGRLYVVIADHRRRGGFNFDGGCGQTAHVGRPRFHRLVRFAKHA